MKTILATTYAVNPYKGSEDAMGWNYVYQAARFHKIIAITRENNQQAIEKYMLEHPDDVYANIRFLYYDLPPYLRWWKRGSRGAMLYFLLWQKGVIGFIKKQELTFDITHHLNFHNDWSPSFLWQLGKPFVWGPIGHHPEIPEIFRGTMSRIARLKSRATHAVKYYFWNFSPALSKTRNKAAYIWCMNDSVPQVLDLNGKAYGIAPSVATQDFGYAAETSTDEFRVFSAGRLVPLKGFDLTIRAFAAFSKSNPGRKTSLTIVGAGPERDRLIALAESLEIRAKLRLIDWVVRDELMEMMSSASVFLFPSHEGAGMVVPEALSFGLPVITIDNCGPGQFIGPEYGIVVAAETYQGTVNGLSAALSDLSHDRKKYAAMRKAARTAFEEKFHWDRRGEALQSIYANLPAS